MKKLMMIAAMMVATLSANAQFEPGTFSIQPKVGINLAKVSNMPKFTNTDANKTVDRTLLGGAVIGAEAEYQIAKPFSVAAGLNFSMQGCQWEDYDYTDAAGIKYEEKDNKIELNYLNIPVVANFYLFKGFAVKAGVQMGFLLSAKTKGTEIIDKKSTTNVDVDVKDYCNKVDFSIPVGVSYQVPTIPIYIDARAIFGLKDIIKDVPSDAKNFKNQVFQLTVGYKFKL